MGSFRGLLAVLAVVGFSTTSYGAIDFSVVPSGTIVSSDTYKAQGVLLLTDSGQQISTNGSGLIASGNGHITVEFVMAGTSVPGAVEIFDIRCVDNAPGGTNYTFTGYDANHNEVIGIGNNVSYTAHSQSFPFVHSIDFTPSKPLNQVIGSLDFSVIQAVPEPSCIALVCCSGAALLMRRRQKS